MSTAGKNQVLKVGNAVGTLVDVSQYLNEARMPQEAETIESTAFGAQEKSYVTGFRSGSVNGGGQWEEAIHDILATAVGAAGVAVTRAFEYYPEGTDTGNIKYSGTLVVLNYSVSGSVGALTGFTFDARSTGAVTRATV